MKASTCAQYIKQFIEKPFSLWVFHYWFYDGHFSCLAQFTGASQWIIPFWEARPTWIFLSTENPEQAQGSDRFS